MIRYAVEFYNSEPRVQRKLKHRRRGEETKKDPRTSRRKSKSPSAGEEKQTNKKFAKFENLRPLSNFLLTILNDHDVPHFKTKKIVGDIIERIVIAGYDWERIQSYQTKGQDHFNKKLIPYIFMSKDDLPLELGPETLLIKLFRCISGLNRKKEEKSTCSSSNILGKRKLMDSDIDPNDDELSAKVNDFINRKDKRRRSSSSDSIGKQGKEKRKMKKEMTEERRSSSDSSSSSKTKLQIDLTAEKEQSPGVSDSSTDIDQMFTGGESKEKQKQSLLEKVNEIIKSCVRLKTEKKISGMKLEKANKIIAKAEAKKIKLLNHTSPQEDGEDCIEINTDENDLNVKPEEKNPADIEEGEITDDDDDDDVMEVPVEVKAKHQVVRKSSVSSELQAMAGHDNKVTRMSLARSPRSPRSTRSTRSPSWSPSHSYRKKAATVGGSRYNHHQYRHSSRSVSTEEEEEESELSRWIPITPCTIQEDVEVEPMSSVMVNIKAKGEFSFKDNLGCYVRITKWTGKDSVDFLTIKPQVIKIESSQARVEMSNTYSDKFLNIYKHDKVACMSILSSPPPSSMLSRMDCSPERYQSQDKRWFKVTTVVLHKKGEQSCV